MEMEYIFRHFSSQAVSSRQLPLCCVVCNTKIQRVKNNNSRDAATSASDRKSLPSSVSGYSLAKSVSNYSIKSGFCRDWKVENNTHLFSSTAASSSSHVSGRSVRSSASLQSIASIRSTGSGSSWFSVNSLSSFQCAGLDRNHNNKPRVSGISINDNLDICFPQLVRPCCQTVQTFVKLFNRVFSSKY